MARLSTTDLIFTLRQINVDDPVVMDMCEEAADHLEYQKIKIDRLKSTMNCLENDLMNSEMNLAIETARVNTAVAELSGSCGSCKFSSDCAKHDNNDSSAGYAWFTDCDDWEWHYDDESAIS